MQNYMYRLLEPELQKRCTEFIL